jgi:Mn-containing catalase
VNRPFHGGFFNALCALFTGDLMFYHDKRLQYRAQPERPDPLFAKKLQEVLGGQWGEMSVMMMYLFQGWNCRGPKRYRDLLLDIGTEEISHVEMVATMIGQLLADVPVEDQQAAARQRSLVSSLAAMANPKAALMSAAMNPQHLIVSGLGAAPNDSVGFPWTARYIVASGNLLADFRMNVTAESQGRLQVARLYEITEDAGVRDMFSFMLARDTMHQNMWLAAIKDLEQEGYEMTPCPSNFPLERERRENAYQFYNCSKGGDSRHGLWAQGPAPDGRGAFEYVPMPEPMGPEPVPPGVDPLTYGTQAATDGQVGGRMGSAWSAPSTQTNP